MSYASEETDNPITAEFALNVFPATPMFYDVEAIWVLYGEPPGGVNSGDNIYTSWDVPDVNLFQALHWAPTTAVTLVDTGGRDTLYLGDTSDIVIFFTAEGGTVGLGSINGAPRYDDGRFAFNLVFHGEIENLHGGAGNDFLMGAGADNRLVGESGHDVLTGGAGADTFVFQPSDGPSYYTDTIVDFNPGQGDRIDLRAYRDISGVPDNWFAQTPDSSRSRVVDLDGDGYEDIVLEGYTGRLDDDDFIFAGGNTNTGTTTVTGTTGDDNPLAGTDGDDRLAGLAGDDYLVAWDGDDHLDGGDGNDILDGGPGADVLIGGPGDDTVSYLFSPAAITVNLHDGTAGGGDAQGDTLGDDIENLWGSAYDDVLTGTNSLAVGNFIFGLAGNDEIYGGLGNDYLVGGSGADVLIGGPGDDTAAYWNSAAGVTVRLHSLEASGGDAEGDTFPYTVDVVYAGAAGLAQTEALPDVEHLIGSDHNDTLAGDRRDNRLYGEAGNDNLYGGPGGGDDSLFGGLGHDRLYGGLGDDILYGEAGDDNLYGGPGEFDYLHGGDGDDHLDGGDGNDWLEGGPGADQLAGGPGADTASYFNSTAGVTVRLHSREASGGDAEGDTWGGLVTVRYTREGQVFQETVPDIIDLGGSNHDDTLAGDSRDNVLYGEAGNDTLYGGPGGGDDSLHGHNGDDALYGGRGDDTLVGGPGADHLAGGPGADQFLFEPGDTLDFNDVITDFNPAQGDRIVLSGYEVSSFQDRYWLADGSADTYVDLDGDGWSDIFLAGYTEPLLDDYFIFV